MESPGWNNNRSVEFQASSMKETTKYLSFTRTHLAHKWPQSLGA